MPRLLFDVLVPRMESPAASVTVGESAAANEEAVSSCPNEKMPLFVKVRVSTMSANATVPVPSGMNSNIVLAAMSGACAKCESRIAHTRADSRARIPPVGSTSP